MSDLSEARRFVDEMWQEFFLPPEELTVEEWADGRLVLPREMSAEPGPIRLDRTPYMRQIFRDLADPLVEEIVLMFGTQLAKSTALLALMSYIIDHEPAPVMLVLPTVDVAKKFSKQRIAPLVAANDFLKESIRNPRARDSGNTVLVKEFPGGILVIVGANSAAGLASMPCKVILFDEIDDYPDDAGGQGEPIALATARQDTFARRKRVKCSSPKRPKGESPVEKGYQSGTRFKYHVPCPECGHKQVLTWPGMNLEACKYACAECGVLIGEHHKPRMLADGEWIAEDPQAKKRTYWLSSLYSPIGWLSWSTLAREWADAMREREFGNLQPLRTFINTRLAETWEEQAAKLVANEIQERAQPFPLKTVPREALVVVAFVDVQDDRFEVAVWGIDQTQGMWTVDHVVLPADPGREEDWAKVDAALATSYRHELGGELKIEASAIDTGGHYTHDVYRFVRVKPSWRKIAATQGRDQPGMPILGRASTVDVNIRGGVIKHGCKLWGIGVNPAKDLLFNRIRAGKVHTSQELPTEWFEQLAAEQRVKKETARGVRWVWQKKSSGIRNEALDGAVGAIWCGERLGCAKWSQKYWARLRQKVTVEKPQEPTQEVQQTADVPHETPPVAQKVKHRMPRPRGFTMRWRE